MPRTAIGWATSTSVENSESPSMPQLFQPGYLHLRGEDHDVPTVASADDRLTSTTVEKTDTRGGERTTWRITPTSVEKP